MNILFVIRRFPLGGGTESVTNILINEFCDRGHKIYVVYFEKKYSDFNVETCLESYKFPNEQVIESKLNIEFLQNLLLSKSIHVFINQQFHELKYSKLCHSAKQNTEAKLIQCHHFSLLMQIYSKTGLITKMLPEALVCFLKKIRELRKRNIAYEESDIVVLLSQKFIEQYKKLMPRKNLNNLRAIANPLVLNDSICLEKKQNKILFVARMEEEQKQISLALLVWEIIYKKHNDWSMIFLGDGPDLQKLKDKAKCLPRLSFEGFRNPKPYYEEASILLQTSARSFEGFGMTIAEAQSFGCVPVAMNSYLSLSDIIDDEKNGYITEYGNVNAMAEKVQALIENENLRNQMALCGIESVKKFDVKIIANKWEKLFNEL